LLDIIVLEGFLIHEQGTPSTALGLSPSETDNAVWLVELCHTRSVQKFSGTLMHPDCQDKVGLTLASFAHFVYDASHEKLVLADILVLLQLRAGVLLSW
jgi:Alpha-kinase family